MLMFCHLRLFSDLRQQPPILSSGGVGIRGGGGGGGGGVGWGGGDGRPTCLGSLRVSTPIVPGITQGTSAPKRYPLI